MWWNRSGWSGFGRTTFQPSSKQCSTEAEGHTLWKAAICPPSCKGGETLYTISMMHTKSIILQVAAQSYFLVINLYYGMHNYVGDATCSKYQQLK